MNSNKRIKIELRNQYCKIVSDLDKETAEAVYNQLAYTDKELLYQSKTDPSINPYFSCFNTTDQTFLTGVLDRVVQVIEELGFEVEFVNSYEGTLYNGEINENSYPYNCLRYYQLDSIRKALEYKRATIKLPTRSGKSATIASLVKLLPGHGFITVPSKELLYQLAKDIYTWAGEKPGLIGDGLFEVARINIGTPRSIINRIKEFDEFHDFVKESNWLITDECHLTAADTYLNLSNYLTKRAYSIGFSATLYREDGKDLLIEAINGPLVYSVSSIELIEHNPPYLTKPKIRMVDCPVYHRRPYLNSINPSFKTVYRYAITHNQYRNQLIVRHALQAVELGMSPVLILVQSISHGKQLQELFKREHKKVKFISSGSKERQIEVREISLGRTDILISSKILTTGVNIKPLRTLIYAMGGRSRISTIQAAGRPLTLFPNKEEAWIIDYYDLDSVYVNIHSKIRYQAYKEEYGNYVKRVKNTELHLGEIFHDD
jgi:superfamily II DNA or RNA helicase